MPRQRTIRPDAEPSSSGPANELAAKHRDVGSESVAQQQPNGIEGTSETRTGKQMSKPAANTQSGSEFHRYPLYSPRFWHGMLPLTWFRLLKGGRFRIHPFRIPMVISVTLATPINLVLAWIQSIFFRRALSNTELQGTPVFILGHWRSGTTLLHELMVRDERLSSPSTFQCFCPHHFLVSEWLFQRYFWWLLPGKRPMDNMAAGWDRPQEDEFALLTLGLPSPYRRIAFPNEPPPDMDYLDFQGVDPDAVNSWLKKLRWFLIRVSKSTGRPLVIKSPTHTGRIAYLAREFPEAKFIHITRDPIAIFPSSCRLWRSLDDVQALQIADWNHLEDYVIDCFKRLYAAFHKQRDQIDPSRIVDVRYEELIENPVETLRGVYEDLRLSDFDSVQPTIQAWADSEHRQYKTNRHLLDPQTEAKVRSEWHEYFERYGYR